MSMTQNFIGVDVAKDWIDVHHLATGKKQRIPTTKKRLTSFATASGDALVVLEASGGYERALTDALARAGTAYARVNPRQAREFARACGRLAKTDRVDAKGLAEMGRALELTPTPPGDPNRVRLADLVARRDDLVVSTRREKNRVLQVHDAWIKGEIKRLIRVLEGHLARVEAEVSALVQAHRDLRKQSRRLCSVPGIGPVISAAILALLPELGQLCRRQTASLAGLAPHACDSGLHRGKRRIWGGRAGLRRVLYLAAFIASRYDPAIKAFRQRLQDAGKPVKLAITACARKLLTILNAMFREEKDYKPAVV